MNKIRNKSAFTLAELLIVIAIIAVLTAIAIPVFTTQLERSRDAVTLNNLRTAYAEAVNCYLTNNGANNTVSDGGCVFYPMGRASGLYFVDKGGWTYNGTPHPLVLVKDVEFVGKKPGFEMDFELPFFTDSSNSDGVYQRMMETEAGSYFLLFAYLDSDNTKEYGTEGFVFKSVDKPTFELIGIEPSEYLT